MTNTTIHLNIRNYILKAFIFLCFSLNAQVSTFPYSEDFESGPGLWSVLFSNTSTWEWGSPSGNVINSAASGSNSFVTNLDGNYVPDEDGYVLSPEFDLSALIDPIVEFSLWWESEESWDGAVLQSSTDLVNWQNVGQIGTGVNWYNTTSIGGSPGEQLVGWSGSGTLGGVPSGGWVTVSHPISNLAGQSSIYFRLAFGSDNIIHDEGVAFDDFSIKDLSSVISIPDPQFELALIELGIDTDDTINQQVLERDIYFVNELQLTDYNIANFEGLQHFTSLEEFRLFTNQVATPTIIDFSGNSRIRRIHIQNFANLSAINVSQNILLEDLLVSTNGTLFGTIDVTENINLRSLIVVNSQLGAINLRNNTLIESLFLYENPINTLDVSTLNELKFLSLYNTQIQSLDLDTNTNLESLSASNAALNMLSLNNGTNTNITAFNVTNNPNLNCIFVDEVSFAEAQTNWFKDISSNYIDSALGALNVVQTPQDLVLDFDIGYQTLVDEWLNNNGNAIVTATCGEVTWDYEVFDNELSDTNFDDTLDRLTVSIDFFAYDDFGVGISLQSQIIFNDFASAGESAGNGGTICDDTYSISDFDNDLFTLPEEGVNYNDSKFNASTFQLVEISGKPGLELESSTKKVRFPDTGAGQFTYSFKLEVQTPVIIGTKLTKTYETSTTYTANSVTVAFEPGPNITVVVCDFENLSLLDLYNELEIQLDVDTTQFNEAADFGNVFEPQNSWYNETDDLEANPNLPPLTEITGPGVYQFNAKAFLEDCAGEPVFVTLTSENFETYTIPDENFEAALIAEGIDLDDSINGVIQTCGITNVTSLNLNGYNISNFSGLEFFTDLRTFSLFNNLTVSFHTIDFSGNPDLEYIGIFNAPKLFNIVVTSNLALTELTVQTNDGSFDGINLSQNSNLTHLDFSENRGLANIQLPNSPIIEALNFRNTSILNFELENFTSLVRLDLFNCSNISELNLSNTIQLESLNVSGTSISDVDLSNLNQLNYLEIVNTDIKVLDISSNPLIQLLSNDNQFLRIVNLSNGNNSNLQLVDLSNNSNLSCVLVDDFDFALSASNWQIDAGASYTDDSICGLDAENDSVQFDGIGNQNDVIAWLNSNGGAIIYSTTEVLTTNSFVVNQIDNQIRYETIFESDNGIDSFTTNAIFTIFTGNFNAGVDFEPIDGDVAGGIEEEGSLCDQESGTFDLKVFNRNNFEDPIDFSSGIYENAVVEYKQDLIEGTGGAVTSIDGTVVRFPDTGAGQFSYHYTLSVSKEVQLFGVPDPIIITDKADVWHWLTIPFNPGSEKELIVCPEAEVTLQELYNVLEIEDGTTATDFNPDAYWFDSNGFSITEVNGPGEYIFNAEEFLPQCGGVPTIVTVIEDVNCNALATGSLIISEVMQNPNAVNDASGQYFEVYNPETLAVNLKGWTITNDSGELHTISLDLIVDSDDFIVLGNNSNTGTNGGVSVDYEYANFNLTNTSDAIILKDGEGTEIDRIDYDGGVLWPNPNGAAMLYIGSTIEDNNNGTLWKTATSSEGITTDLGSPGRNGTDQIIDWLVYDTSAWNKAPSVDTAAKNALIRASEVITFSTDIALLSLVVKEDADVRINAATTLDVPNIILESTSEKYASLISDGTITGTLSYRLHVNTNAAVGGNDLITPPVSGEAFNTFAVANNNLVSNADETLFLFGPFDKESGDYVTYGDTETETLSSGIGYRAATIDNGTLNFNGTINQERVEQSVTFSESAFSKWNLIGNPYPSYLNVQAFLNNANNLSVFDANYAGIYGYDGNALDGWVIYNLNTIDAITTITPGQGFFVAVNSDASIDNGTFIEFTKSMRAHGNTDDFIQGRNSVNHHLRIQLSTTSNSYHSDFYFNKNSTNGLDPGYDAAVFGRSAGSFAIYSHLIETNTDIDMAIQSLPIETVYNTIIPLGVNANQAEQLTIAIEASSLPQDVNVYLKDVTENSFTLLNTNDYVFTPTEILNGTGRFFLHFSNSTLTNPNEELNALHIYTLKEQKQIVIKGQLQSQTKARLYDINGRLILTTVLEASNQHNTINTRSLQNGIYLLQLENSLNSKSHKISID